MTKGELIFAITDPFKFHPKLFSLIIDTYQWFMSEKELFEIMLSRISPITPFNLSPSEKEKFKKQQKHIKMKVLIFVREWFKKYRDLVITVEELQTLFRELIYLIYKCSESEIWVIEQLKVILRDLELYSKRSLYKALYNRE